MRSGPKLYLAKSTENQVQSGGGGKDVKKKSSSECSDP